jgi:DNA-directed RNA polymerase specialized sigma24 family protein
MHGLIAASAHDFPRTIKTLNPSPALIRVPIRRTALAFVRMENMPLDTDRKTPSPFTEQEFERLHKTYNPKLFFWFRKRVNADVAEELAAATLVKSWQSDYRGECAISTWIYGIADSVLADWRKSAKQRNQFLENAMENRLALERKYTLPDCWEQSSEVADPAPNPEKQAMIREQLAGRFSDPRLGSLDAATKDILIRYIHYGDSAVDIAGDLGVTPDAIYKKIRRVCPNS